MLKDNFDEERTRVERLVNPFEVDKRQWEDSYKDGLDRIATEVVELFGAKGSLVTALVVPDYKRREITLSMTGHDILTIVVYYEGASLALAPKMIKGSGYFVGENHFPESSSSLKGKQWVRQTMSVILSSVDREEK